MGVRACAADLERVLLLMLVGLGVKYEDLAYATANGFAAMGTNNGHNGTTGIAFLNNPEVLEDFSYRA